MQDYKWILNMDKNYKKIIIRDYNPSCCLLFFLRFFSSNSKDTCVLKCLNYYYICFFLFSFSLICLNTEMENA